MWDMQNMYSVKQEFAPNSNGTTRGNNVSTNVVFVGYGDPGPGQPKIISVHTNPITGTGTIDFTIQHAATELGVWDTLINMRIPNSALLAGGILPCSCCPSGRDHLRGLTSKRTIPFPPCF